MQIWRHDTPTIQITQTWQLNSGCQTFLKSPEGSPPTRRALQPWEAVLHDGTRLLQVIPGIYRNSNAARAPSTFSIHNHRRKSTAFLQSSHTTLQFPLGMWQPCYSPRNLFPSPTVGPLPHPLPTASFPGGNKHGEISPNILHLAGKHLVLSSGESAGWGNALPARSAHAATSPKTAAAGLCQLHEHGIFWMKTGVWDSQLFGFWRAFLTSLAVTSRFSLVKTHRS